jgi:hypothetical protein
MAGTDGGVGAGYHGGTLYLFVSPCASIMLKTLRTASASASRLPRISRMEVNPADATIAPWENVS